MSRVPLKKLISDFNPGDYVQEMDLTVSLDILPTGRAGRVIGVSNWPSVDFGTPYTRSMWMIYDVKWADGGEEAISGRRLKPLSDIDALALFTKEG